MSSTPSSAKNPGERRHLIFMLKFGNSKGFGKKIEYLILNIQK